MQITLYAALLALLFLKLSFSTINQRRSAHVALGDGGNSDLTRAMRVHANFAEYTPMGLLLALLVELAGGHWALVHVVGLALLLGRAIHSYGVSQTPENFRYRVAGMILTFGSLSVSAVSLLVLYGQSVWS